MKNQIQRLAPYILLALVACGVTYSLGSPITRDEGHWWRMVLAAIGVGFVGIAYGIQQAPESLRSTGTSLLRAGMVVAIVFGWFNYYQFDRKKLEGIADISDMTYYYVNSKYLAELGYFGLYPAMIVADAEGERRHSKHVKRYRDLRDYEVKPVALAYEHGKDLKENAFTPQRWKEFTHDVDYFLQRLSTRSMTKNIYVDHGYNPPPTWSVPGAFLANLAPVENVKSIALVDTVLVASMFCAIAWAFGFDATLFAMLFFLCTFSGRWPALGEALLRFDWLSCLVIAMCCFKKQRWMLAGLFLTYASLNRIFPTIFFWGWGVVFLIDLYQERKVTPRHRSFLTGVLVMSVVLIGTAMLQFGPATFKTSAHNLLMHNKSYSSHRVGLGDLMLFRGEKTRTEMALTTHPNGPEGKRIKGIQAKEYTIRDMQGMLRGIALVAVGLITLYAIRTRRDVWELMPLAILPFYCATNPQINYYNLRLLLFVWHGWSLMVGTTHRKWHAAGLGLLFATEFATQFAYLSEVPDVKRPGRMQRVERYYVTCTTSLWLGIYFVGLIAGLVRDAFPPAEDTAQEATPAAV